MRRQAGLTVRQLAQRMGTDHNRVWRIEVGERRIDLVEFFWFLESLDADPKKELLALCEEFRKHRDVVDGKRPRRKPRRGRRA